MKPIGGAPELSWKVWAGPSYGDSGFVYMSRGLANAVLNISGAAVYTLTTVKPSDIQAIDFDFVKWVVGLRLPQRPCDRAGYAGTDAMWQELEDHRPTALNAPQTQERPRCGAFPRFKDLRASWGVTRRFTA